MSMKSFRTDTNAVSEGVWIDLPYANEDGTIPSFKLKGMGTFNPEFTVFKNKKYKPFMKLLQANALPQKKLDKLFLETVKEFALVDWRNVQPKDDGHNIDYNQDNIDSIVFDPQWRALIEYITDEAAKHETYNPDNMDIAAGN